MGLTAGSVARLKPGGEGGVVGFWRDAKPLCTCGEMVERGAEAGQFGEVLQVHVNAFGTATGAITLQVLGGGRFPKMEARCSPVLPFLGHLDVGVWPMEVEDAPLCQPNPFHLNEFLKTGVWFASV